MKKEKLTREWTKLRERGGVGSKVREKREGRGSYEGMGRRRKSTLRKESKVFVESFQ